MMLFSADGLAKRFGDRRVLDGVHLQLAAGETCILSGDNGSGKTSLLKCLAGLIPADAGTGEFRGSAVDFRAYPAWLRRDVIYVHQHPYLFDTTVADNVDYGLRLRGLARSARRPLVQEAMAWAGVTDLQSVRPRNLSGGEKQRVALARAKVLRPRVLLLDEPTANLDHEARASVIALIEHLVAEDNGVVIACHDRELLSLPGVERLHLQDGRLVREEPYMRVVRGEALPGNL